MKAAALTTSCVGELGGKVIQVHPNSFYH